MPYAQIDISAPRHRKLSMLSDAAFRLWVVALCYCQEHLTDGVLHANAVQTLLPGRKVKPAVIDELVSGQLWDRDPDNGWRVHDYLTWNESRAKVEERRAKWRRRRTAGTHQSVPSGVHPGVHGTLRSDPIRSTDQEQKEQVEHRPDGRSRPLRTTPQTDPPKPALLAAIAHEVLRIDPTLGDADLKEAVKARAAQVRVAYDADSVRKALDSVQAVRKARETR